MKVAIRADSASHIGSGHVMRCLTLAQALREREAEVVFICRKHALSLEDVIRQQGFEVRLLPAGQVEKVNPDNSREWLSVSQEQDAQECLAVLQNDRVDWVVVDHYSLDRQWESQIKKYCEKILIIDDLADRPHDGTVLLDQNFFPGAAKRYEQFLPADAILLCGPRYALLKKEFSQKFQTEEFNAKKSGETPKKILVYFGSTDRGQTAQKVIAALGELRDLDFYATVLLGAANPFGADIRKSAQNDSRVQVMHSVENIHELMRETDLYVGAGGTITWERLCAGLPGIVIAISENQRVISVPLAEAGYQVYLGETDQVLPSKIRDAIRYFMGDESGLKLLKRKGLELVDGQGTKRVAQLMFSFDLSLRKIGAEDCELVYRWCNDSASRRYSLNPDPFGWESHEQWFSAMLANPLRQMLIAQKDGEDVGVIRYDLLPKKQLAVVSVYLNPKLHGRGMGMPLLYHGNQWIKANRPEIKKLSAEIHVENTASIHLFESLHFEHYFHQYILKWDA